MVRKGSSVRVRQRACRDLQGKAEPVGVPCRDLAQRGRNFRPHDVDFVTPRAPVVVATRPALQSIPRLPPAGDLFSGWPRLAPSSVGVPGRPRKRRTPGPVAGLVGGKDRSFGITAAHRGRRAEGQPRGPP
jgi:hypothetical protein